jgi:malonate decarboxylase alpha subunit
MAIPKPERLARVSSLLDGKVLPTRRTVEALELLLEPGDRVALEGDNQKQADFLSRALVQVDPVRVHGLHMVMSCLTRPEHLDLFEGGVAERCDFAYSGPQSLRVAQGMADGTLKVGAIHTYPELYARMYLDLFPQVALIAADQGDACGNLYTGAHTEDTPVMAETAAFRGGVVVAQVNELVGEGGLPRVDIPGDWVDVVVPADRPYQLEALFTRDPRRITEVQILMAMLAIRGVYERHRVTSLNHGIGFNTAAIELLLPNYADSLGLKSEICCDWALNPHPTLIPAIETGWVRSVIPFGGEVGMAEYCAAHPEIFPWARTGPCGPTAWRRRQPACMPPTCSSARPCRWMSRATPPPSPQAVSPASAAPPTWASARRPPPFHPRLGRVGGCRGRARPEAGGADGGDLR